MNAINHTAFGALAAFRINDTLAFHDSAEDLARSSLDEAHALALVLGNVLGETEDGEMTIRLTHLGRAVDGIRTLIALAAWASECEREGR